MPQTQTDQAPGSPTRTRTAPQEPPSVKAARLEQRRAFQQRVAMFRANNPGANPGAAHRAAMPAFNL